MEIYANLLGNWVKLKDTDTIFNENPVAWVKEHDLRVQEFIQVGYDGAGYKISASCIQIVRKA
jgi:hypothetical protein